ncbi:MAG: Stp1/IreP family PP2C-type Ser/Thr phosphatase [Myxococcales bacterium]
MAKGRKRKHKGSSVREGKAGDAGLSPASEAPPPPPPAAIETPPPAPTPAAPAPAHQPKLSVHGASDVGRKRDTNQDSFLIDESLRLFVVADGMGGHAGGGTASRLAVETLQSELAKSSRERPEAFGPAGTLEASRLPDVLRDAVEAACYNIFHEAKGNPSLAGMGTTATVLLIHGPHAFAAHVGDSRLYLVRQGEIHQISDDHSLVNEQIKAGVLTPDEARHSQFKNVITRSVGFEEDVLVDLLGLSLEVGDTFVICCDGLSNLVEDQEIAAMVRGEKVEDLPLRLIALANDRGGDDNITVIAVRVEEL